MEKQKYEKDISECKKWRSFIKTDAQRNITILSRKELYHVQTEYIEIVKVSEIPNGKDEIEDIWNESSNDNVPYLKRGKYHKFLLTDDDRSLSMSRTISRNLKENFPNHKQKHIVRLKLWYELNNPKT